MQNVNVFAVLTLLFCAVLASDEEGFANPIRFKLWADRNFSKEPSAPVPGIQSRLIFDRRFTTKLDHFGDNDDSVWDMKYFSNDGHFLFGGPMFVFVGGDWPITFGWVTGGHMYDMAKEMHGYIFYTEHRFYGDSRPTPDVSTENLKYLSVDQAIEDLAEFIIHQKATIRGLEHSKVILVGTAYSGSLVTWFSQAHPDLVDFTWASSAPLEARVDFADFKVSVGETINSVGGEECYERLESAFSGLEGHITAGNRSYVQQQFNLCNTLTNTLDVWSFFSGLSNSVALLVQQHDGESIQSFCRTFIEVPLEDDVEAFASLFNDGSSQCTDASYVSFRLEMGETNWSSKAVQAGSRQWYYQTCSEFGWFQTSNAAEQPFGGNFPLELNIQMCMDFFNSVFQMSSVLEAVERTNENRNGTEPDVQNVFFTHGEFDPWRVVGVQGDINETSPLVILTGYSHSQDLYSIRDSDSEQMKGVKDMITQYIRRIVGF